MSNQKSDLISLHVATILILLMFVSFSVTLDLNTITQKSYALQQVAGDIVIEVNPGETKNFTWGLLSDRNGSSTVTITADGVGAEFLSFPQNYTLPVSGEITYIPVNVTMPPNYAGARELTPSLRATQAGEQIGATIINIAMSKLLCIIVDQGNSTGTESFGQQELLRNYTYNVLLHDNGGANQSITIPIKSNSNITEFNYNNTNKELSFIVSGDAGTNGTTIVYVDQILQEPYSLTVDGIPSTDFEIITNATNGERGIHITYRHGCIDNNIILTGAGVTS